MKVKHEVNRLYLLHIKFAQPACYAVQGRGDEVALRWHERFGHVNMAALRKLDWEELVCGLPEIRQVEQLWRGVPGWEAEAHIVSGTGREPGTAAA